MKTLLNNFFKDFNLYKFCNRFTVEIAAILFITFLMFFVTALKDCK